MTVDVEGCFRTHRARVYRWAYGMCRRHDDALDVVQEVFLRMLNKRPALPNPAATIGWLRRVTTRVVIDRWRAESARAAREAARATVAPGGDPLENHARAEQLRAVLESLSEQQRLVLMGKCYDQMTFRQIATELGIAVPTAKTHYLRALSAARQRMRADIEAGSVS